jgi:PAS domain-containing protein
MKKTQPTPSAGPCRPAGAASDAAKSLRARAEKLAAKGGAGGAVKGLAVEETQALVHELEVHRVELELQNEELVRSQGEIEARNRILNVFLTVPDEQMYADVLAIILEVMESRYGVFGYLDERGDMVIPTMTRTVWDQCQVADKRYVFPRETWGQSSWPRAIRQKRTICQNTPSTLTPKGHIPMTRHISLPLIHRDKAVGLIQVANKESDYSAGDVALLETLGRVIAPVLDARLQHEQQDAARRQAQEGLRQSEERFQLATRATRDALYDWNLRKNTA